MSVGARYRWKLAIVVVAILLLAAVPTALLIQQLNAPPQPDPSQPDLILHNGVVVTMDGLVAEAVAVRGDRITAIGSDAVVLALRGPDTRLFDLGGNALLPGFIDSHSHWIGDRILGRHGTPARAIEAALQSGWTSISELSVDSYNFGELLSRDKAGLLRLRVNAYLTLSYQDYRFGSWYQAYQPGQEFSSRLRVAGVKVFMDTGPGAGYADRNYWFTQEELDDLLAQAHAVGFQLAVHAIVDNATDTVLNSFEKVLGDRPDQYRPRIEHAVMLRDDQLARMQRLGVVASIQLSWFNSDWTEEILKDPGPEWAHLVARWRDLLDAGVHTIGGTDHPWTIALGVEGYDGPPTTVGPSMKAIYDAVTRVGEQGLPPPSWMRNQRITVDQALRLLTIDAAYGTFQEDVKGSITVGKLADFVVLSEDPRTISETTLEDIEVLVTIVGGRPEYCAPGYETWCSADSPGSPLPSPTPPIFRAPLTVPGPVANSEKSLRGGLVNLRNPRAPT